MSFTFGLDWDGTVTRAPNEFLAFAKSLMAAGHKVYVVTMRYASEIKEIAAWEGHVSGFVFSDRKAKKTKCEELGIHVDIWIEDNPMAIYKDGKDIWGFVTPEGFIHENPVSDAGTIVAAVAVPAEHFDTLWIAYPKMPEKNTGVAITGKTLDKVFNRDWIIVDVPVNARFIEDYKEYCGIDPVAFVRNGGDLKLVHFKTVSALDVFLKIEQHENKEFA